MDKRLIKLFSVVVIIFGLAFWTCRSKEDKSIYIAIAKYVDNKQYSAYKEWLHDVDTNIVLIDMYHTTIDSALMLLAKCSGLLMNGGADVHPGYYDQFEDTIICEIDGHRDTLEMALLSKAKMLKMPVFGICRGLQVINVFYGGTLYPDIPTRFDTTVSHRNEERSYENYHPIIIKENSRLHEITGTQLVEVNSVHHQGIEAIAPSLKEISWSMPDSLIEAIEPADHTASNLVMAVQWHPERLGKFHPMSGSLAKKFVAEAVKYHQQTKTKQN